MVFSLVNGSMNNEKRNAKDRQPHFSGQFSLAFYRTLWVAIAIAPLAAIPSQAMTLNFASGASGSGNMSPAFSLEGLSAGSLGKTSVGIQGTDMRARMRTETPGKDRQRSQPSPQQVELSRQIAALFTNRASNPFSGATGWMTTPLGGAVNEDSDFFRAFSMERWRSGEVWVGVQVIAFVHDALEEIDMVRTPLDFSSKEYSQLPRASLHGSSDPNAQAANGQQNPDQLRTDLRQRTMRITNLAPQAPDAFTPMERDSEAREHELEARDATLGLQLRREAGQDDTKPVADQAPVSAFDPAHNQLGYAQYYEEAVSAEEPAGSGSMLAAFGTWLLLLGLLQFGVRWLIARELE